MILTVILKITNKNRVSFVTDIKTGISLSTISDAKLVLDCHFC